MLSFMPASVNEGSCSQPFPTTPTLSCNSHPTSVLAIVSRASGRNTLQLMDPRSFDQLRIARSDAEIKVMALNARSQVPSPIWETSKRVSSYYGSETKKTFECHCLLKLRNYRESFSAVVVFFAYTFSEWNDRPARHVLM